MKAIISFISIAAMVSMIFAQPSTTNSLRFVNAIEGTTITIYSNKLDSITLDYQGYTQYTPIADGTIQITNILDQNGNSLTGGNPLLTSFGPYNTLVAVMNQAETDPNKKFLLVLFNETAPANMDTNTDTTKSWIRLMDFSQNVRYITMASQAGAIAQYIGFLQTTAYTSISSTTSQLRFYNPETQTYNTPSLLLPTSFTASNAYTVMFYTSSNGDQSAFVVNDRAVGSGSVPMTTAAPQQPMTTGDVSGSMTTQSAPQPMTTQSQTPAMTTRGTVQPPSGPNNNEANGSEKLVAFGLVSIVAIVALF